MDYLIKLYFLIPLCLLAITVILLVRARSKLKNRNECTGTIIGFHQSKAHSGADSGVHKIISPIISYTVNGKSYEFIGNYYATTMKVGQEYRVLYSKEDYSDARIKWGLFIAPIITGSLALFFTLPVIFYAILKNKGIINF